MELVVLPKKCLIDITNGKWYDMLESINPTFINSDQNNTLPTSNGNKPNNEIGIKLKSLAKQLFDNEIQLFQKKHPDINSSNTTYNRSLLLSMISGGTFIDKIKSMVVLIKHNPIHDIKYLEELVKMCMKKSRRESIFAVDALKDIFTNHILPDRKLNSFNHCGFGGNKFVNELEEETTFNNSKRQVQIKQSLIYAIYEEKLIQIYDAYVSSLVMHSKDIIPKMRSKIIGIMYDLLAEKPQAEQKLLMELVNKIGDVDRTTSSHAVFMITKLLKKHNKMAINVVDNVKSLIMRVDGTARTKYLSICLINQIILNKDDSFLADNLLLLYLNFFKSFSTNFKNPDNKMLTSLLTGINRALPFTSTNKNNTLDNYIDVLFKICHTGSFVVCTQSLILLFQIVLSKPSLEDRYYQVLYESILRCPLHQGNTIMNVYINLLFKSVSHDSCSLRILAMIKRILQVCLHCSAPFVGAILLNLSSISNKLLSLKSPTTVSIKKAVTVDAAIDIDDLPVDFKNKLDRGLFDDDEEEYFEDADKKPTKTSVGIKVKTKKSNKLLESMDAVSIVEHYDPNKRNPKFACANKTQLFELNLLEIYYQQTISHFVKQLSKSHCINYQGDPSIDFTNSKFFEKFSIKTPKKKVFDSVSIMTRKATMNPKSIVTNCHVLEKSLKQLTPEEKIFYDYYESKMKYSSNLKIRKRKRAVDSDDESHVSNLYEDASDLEWTELFQDNAKSNKKQDTFTQSSQDDDSDDELDDISDVSMDNFDQYDDVDDEASELNFD